MRPTTSATPHNRALSARLRACSHRQVLSRLCGAALFLTLGDTEAPMPTPDLDPWQLLEATVQTLADVQRRLGPLAAQRCVCGAYGDAHLEAAQQCLADLALVSGGLAALLAVLPTEEPVDVEIVEATALAGMRQPLPGPN